MDALLPLGPAPRPDSDQDLAARLRAAFVALGGEQVQGLDGAKILPVLDGTDIASLDVDLTGVAVGMPAGKEAPHLHWKPQIVDREPGTVGTLRIEAHPLAAVDLPVDVTAEVSDVRFSWVTAEDDMVGVELIEPTDDAPVSGHARVAVSREGLAGTVQGLLAVALHGNGIQLTDFDLRIDQTGPRDARLEIDASIKKGMFLSAKITATASASVDEHMVLTVGDVQLHSGNPIVGAMLGAMRGRVEEVAGRRVDLTDALPPGVRLDDVALEVGEQVVLTARLA